MAENEAGMRTVVSLSTGARVGATLALVLLLGSGYLLWSPIQLYPADGFPIMCGTAVAPPDNDLGTAACGNVNIIRQWQAGSLALAAVVIALGSVYAFGVQRRREPLIGTEPQGRRGARPSRDE
jgi:hypothetical protein